MLTGNIGFPNMSRDDSDIKPETTSLPPVHFNGGRRFSLQPSLGSLHSPTPTKLPTIPQGTPQNSRSPRIRRDVSSQKSRADICKSPSCPQLFLNVCLAQQDDSGSSSPTSGRNSVKLPDIFSNGGTPRGGHVLGNSSYRGELEELYNKVKQLQNRHGSSESSDFSSPSRENSNGDDRMRSHTHPGIVPGSKSNKPFYRRINSQPALLLPIKPKETKPSKKKHRLKKRVSQVSTVDPTTYDELANDYAEMKPSGSISYEDISGWSIADHEDLDIAERIEGFQVAVDSEDDSDRARTPNSLGQDEDIPLSDEGQNESFEETSETQWLVQNVKSAETENLDGSAQPLNSVSNQIAPEIMAHDSTQQADDKDDLVEFDDLTNIYNGYDDDGDHSDNVSAASECNDRDEVQVKMQNITIGDCDENDNDRISRLSDVKCKEWLDDINIQVDNELHAQ